MAQQHVSRLEKLWYCTVCRLPGDESEVAFVENGPQQQRTPDGRVPQVPRGPRVTVRWTEKNGLECVRFKEGDANITGFSQTEFEEAAKEAVRRELDQE